MDAIFIGLILTILIYIIMDGLPFKDWFKYLVVFSMIAFELALATKFVIDLFTQKTIP